jgi:hypothetical protein
MTSIGPACEQQLLPSGFAKPLGKRLAMPPDEQERFVQRAMKRCPREKWLVKSEQVKADAVAKSPTALSANVRSGADALATALAEDGQATRIASARAHRKATEHAAKLSGPTPMDKDVAQALKHHDQGPRLCMGGVRWTKLKGRMWRSTSPC